MYKCDYCEGPLAPLYKISTNGTPTFTLFEPDFCPKCGTPLGEVKPLTVEQISQLEGKPIFVVDLKDGFKEWVKVQRVLNGGDITTAGGSRGYGSFSSYGTTWLAFDREPKGEAE